MDAGIKILEFVSGTFDSLLLLRLLKIHFNVFTILLSAVIGYLTGFYLLAFTAFVWVIHKLTNK